MMRNKCDVAFCWRRRGIRAEPNSTYGVISGAASAAIRMDAEVGSLAPGLLSTDAYDVG